MRRLFAPILAGGGLSDRLVACLGALLGIGLTAWTGGAIPSFAPALPWLVAPLGASAVLVFAVPTSPLAQPWPVIGGNTLSALVGVAALQLVPSPVWASGVAVAAAILAMSLLRCLHPPGGAAALTAVIGGPAVAGAGWLFPFVPVLLNSAVLVTVALAFHRPSGHSYPHRPHAAPGQALGPPHRPADLEQALAAVGEPFDISREDLELIVRAVEARAATSPASAPS